MWLLGLGYHWNIIIIVASEEVTCVCPRALMNERSYLLHRILLLNPLLEKYSHPYSITTSNNVLWNPSS